SYGYDAPWSSASCANVMSSPYMTGGNTATDVGDITNTAAGYMYFYDYDLGQWNSSFSQASKGPPAGGALFFGNVDPDGTYNGRKVIGYALAKPSDVADMMVVKNCEMVENTDYEVVQVPDDPSQWGPLKDAFTGYFKQRFSGMNAINTDDGCGATSCKLYDDAPTYACSYFYDFLWPGLPWIINFDKQPSPVYGGGTASFVLSSEIAMGAKKI